MLDLRFIRENADLVKENCKLRRSDVDIDKVLELADRKNKASTDVQETQRQQNESAKGIGKAKDPAEREKLIQLGKELREQVGRKEAELAEAEEQLRVEHVRIPNLTHPNAPRDGKDAVLREVGARPSFSFKPLDHVALCEKHKLADFESASKVTGTSFYYMTGDGAMLELALINYAMKLLVGEGYTPMITPDLARERIMSGTGYIPRGPETQVYRIADSDLCLIATAEITLAGMFVDEIIAADRLPLRFVGLSHCFRTEAGAHGKSTKGLYRVHQFTKVEMFAFTMPEQSEEFHAELLGIEEKIFQGLGIPYRVLDIAASDLGGPAYRKYDLEAWMPGRGDAGEWGEITSTSNCTDYQSRRLGIRTKTAGDKGTRYVHMLNGTAIAVGRAIIALLENFQQEDGSILLPPALVPYMGKERIG